MGRKDHQQEPAPISITPRSPLDVVHMQMCRSISAGTDEGRRDTPKLDDAAREEPSSVIPLPRCDRLAARAVPVGHGRGVREAANVRHQLIRFLKVAHHHADLYG